MLNVLPLVRDLVLIGGGHTHALVLKNFAMRPVAGVRLSLINPGPTAAYSGMLPGFIAGHYTREELDIDLVRLARFAGARLVLAPAVGIDRQARRIRIAGQADMAYDLASIDVGITTELPDIPGFADHALGAKPLGTFASRWARFLGEVETGRLRPDIVLIGGGVAGVELALAMAHRLRTMQVQDVRITVLEKAKTPLPGIGAGARRALLAHLSRLGVTLRTGIEVEEIGPDVVRMAGDRELACHLCIGAATARPHDWLRATGLCNADGFVTVGKTLQSLHDERIYAAGDCAHLTHAPRPKAGVFAVREAPILAHNLRAALTGGRAKAYRPQASYLKLISTGGKGAIADKAGLKLDGRLLWRWKDHIDRKFMRKFTDYPAMSAPEIKGERADALEHMLDAEPLCGGCGAKMARTGLNTVLADLPEVRRKDVVSKPGDDAAVLEVGGAQQVLTTDHLRAFINDPYRMSRIAAQHALGDIWAMGAKPQAALASLILPQMRPEMLENTLREIMAAASEVFGAAGAEIVGGHSAQGAELTIGFSVTGLAEGRVIGLDGARAGDVLILTKPIGSGTVLAGEMRLQAKGEWVAAAYSVMERSLAGAAEILRPHACAMTDVTGFGLAGHLDNMLGASKLGAVLEVGDIPYLEGALELAAAGVRSSIWAANRVAVDMRIDESNPRHILLFDPQTAGGLLAAVPASLAEEILTDLHKAGEQAVIIGELKREAGVKLC